MLLEVFKLRKTPLALVALIQLLSMLIVCRSMVLQLVNLHKTLLAARKVACVRPKLIVSQHVIDKVIAEAKLPFTVNALMRGVLQVQFRVTNCVRELRVDAIADATRN